MPTAERHLVIGLDSVPPEILFRRYIKQMPNVQRLLKRARYGTLTSTDPPITVPAWMVMFSGMDPGTLGLYGFRHRRRGSYSDTYLPTSASVHQAAIWDTLSRRGERVCIIGVPPGYPPPHVNGVYISCMLTPPGASDFVWPPSMADEILNVAGGYDFDVQFRHGEQDRIASEIREMTRRRFAVARHLWKKESWKLFVLHEIGPDRLHHTFWKYIDPSHPLYEDVPRFRRIVEEYYAFLDAEIGKLLQLLPNDVAVWIVSDHGSQAMHGCFCINEWLIRKGYLRLKGDSPKRGTSIEAAEIDWRHTKVWAWGGYYARIFFNVRGREPEGTVDPRDVQGLTDRLREELSAIALPDGKPLGIRIARPSDLYREVLGDPPDLIAYFGELRWRSIGTLGYDRIFLDRNDTGPDDSVHSFDGVLVFSDPKADTAGTLSTQRIIDVAPTVLARMGIAIPPGVQGQAISELVASVDPRPSSAGPTNLRGTAPGRPATAETNSTQVS